MGELNVSNRTLAIMDNLNFVRSLNSESIDLIGMDPPFAANETFVGASPPDHAGGGGRGEGAGREALDLWHGSLPPHRHRTTGRPQADLRAGLAPPTRLPATQHGRAGYPRKGTPPAMPKNLIIAALASIIVAAVCVAIVLTQRDDQPFEGWVYCQVRLDYKGPSYASPTEAGCDEIAELRAKRDQLRTALQRAEGERDLFMDLYLALPLTSCLEQQRAFDTHYKIGGPRDRLALRTANLMRRECGDAEAARFIEATTRERPDWAKE